jgi:transcriptional regulator with XRE-family HTH domain
LGAERHAENDFTKDAPHQGSPAGLTQRDLAARLKRPHSFVGRIEAGERRVDVIEFIEIARVMDVDPGQLFSKLVE